MAIALGRTGKESEMGGKSIIQNWEKLRDWELQQLVDKDYEYAILELARRNGQLLLYDMPDGSWAASCEGTIADGFKNKEEAREWVYSRLEAKGWQKVKGNLY